VLGFVKGVGKGLGGVIIKPSAGRPSPCRSFSCWLTALAAILGVPGYAYKGIYKELRKSRGKNVQDFIIAARTADGLEDWEASTVSEREKIVSRWHEIQSDLGKALIHGKHPAQATASKSAV